MIFKIFASSPKVWILRLGEGVKNCGSFKVPGFRHFIGDFLERPPYLSVLKVFRESHSRVCCSKNIEPGTVIGADQ